MGADGSGEQRVSGIEAEESEPAWSPDGTWIAYVRRTPGTPAKELWLMRPDGSERRALTKLADGRAHARVVAGQHAGSSFSSKAATRRLYELFTIGLDGKRLRSGRSDGERQLRAVLVAGRVERSRTRRTARSSRSSSAAAT